MNRFTGVDSQGTARTGTTDASNLAAFVETRLIQGWRRLRVTDADGEEVGGIGPDGQGRRTWWAENGPTHA